MTWFLAECCQLLAVAVSIRYSFKILGKLSFKPSKQSEQMAAHVLQFWVLFAFLRIFESYFEYFIRWFPFYWYFKAFLFLVICIPELKIAHLLFSDIVIPTIDRLQHHVLDENGAAPTPIEIYMSLTTALLMIVFPGFLSKQHQKRFASETHRKFLSNDESDKDSLSYACIDREEDDELGPEGDEDDDKIIDVFDDFGEVVPDVPETQENGQSEGIEEEEVERENEEDKEEGVAMNVVMSGALENEVFFIEDIYNTDYDDDDSFSAPASWRNSNCDSDNDSSVGVVDDQSYSEGGMVETPTFVASSPVVAPWRSSLNRKHSRRNNISLRKRGASRLNMSSSDSDVSVNTSFDQPDTIAVVEHASPLMMSMMDVEAEVKTVADAESKCESKWENKNEDKDRKESGNISRRELNNEERKQELELELEQKRETPSKPLPFVQNSIPTAPSFTSFEHVSTPTAAQPDVCSKVKASSHIFSSHTSLLTPTSSQQTQSPIVADPAASSSGPKRSSLGSDFDLLDSPATVFGGGNGALRTARRLSQLSSSFRRLTSTSVVAVKDNASPTTLTLTPNDKTSEHHRGRRDGHDYGQSRESDGMIDRAGAGAEAEAERLVPSHGEVLFTIGEDEGIGVKDAADAADTSSVVTAGVEKDGDCSDLHDGSSASKPRRKPPLPPLPTLSPPVHEACSPEPSQSQGQGHSSHGRIRAHRRVSYSSFGSSLTSVVTNPVPAGRVSLGDVGFSSSSSSSSGGSRTRRGVLSASEVGVSGISAKRSSTSPAFGRSGGSLPLPPLKTKVNSSSTNASPGVSVSVPLQEQKVRPSVTSRLSQTLRKLSPKRSGDYSLSSPFGSSTKTMGSTPVPSDGSSTSSSSSLLSSSGTAFGSSSWRPSIFDFDIHHTSANTASRRKSVISLKKKMG